MPIPTHCHGSAIGSFGAIAKRTVAAIMLTSPE